MKILLVWIGTIILFFLSAPLFLTLDCAGSSGPGGLGCLATGGFKALLFALAIGILGTVYFLRKK